jgi:hypothetical protein
MLIYLRLGEEIWKQNYPALSGNPKKARLRVQIGYMAQKKPYPEIQLLF